MKGANCYFFLNEIVVDFNVFCVCGRHDSSQDVWNSYCHKEIEDNDHLGECQYLGVGM